MDNKKILLVNLSKGRTGDLNSKLLGMIFVMKFQAAAMSRSDVPEDQRQDFCLYVDEFQNFSTESFATIMSEARKFHLNLVVANQFTTQLTEEIRDAVFGNIGTIVSFRIGQNDVDALSRYFQPQFDGDDLLRVPNYNAIVRTLVSGVPTQPFSMAALPPLGDPNPGLADALKQLSAAKHGKPRAVVEKTIAERFATKAPEPKPFQSPFNSGAAARPAPSGYGASAPAFGAAPAGPALQPAGMPGGGSFLDEWMAKQRAHTPAPMISPARNSLPPREPAPAPMAAPAAAAQAPSPQFQAAPDTGPTAPGQDGGNVSSAQLDQQEIDDIAQELKKTLIPGAPETSVHEESGPLAVKPAPTLQPAPSPTEGTVHLNKPKQQAGPAPDDTIFIDKEGRLRANEPAADAPAGGQV